MRPLLLINYFAFPEAAPSSSRLHDLTLHKLSNSGEWKERRLIVTRTGQLFIWYLQTTRARA